jgi:hypothetical protein
MRAGTVVLILLVAVALMSIGFRVTHLGDRGTSSPKPDNGAPQTDLVPSIRLDILNGTAVDGLAGKIATAVGRVGAIAGDLGNADRDNQVQSLLINRRLSPEVANELARSLGGMNVIFEFDVRSTADAVLILGADHQEIQGALGLRPR